jgi:protein tyrosine/serine phosphatase
MRFFCLAALLAVAGCGLGAEDNFAPLTPTDNLHAIKPGAAYRSAQVDGQSLALIIEALEIQTVINLRGENVGSAWYDTEIRVCAEANVDHVDIRMSANELPPRTELLAVFDTLSTARYPILIHCNAGADRTGAVAAIYRMTILGESYDRAKAELTPLYGHFEAFTPEMDQLVRMYQPSRTWILEEYEPGN